MSREDKIETLQARVDEQQEAIKVLSSAVKKQSKLLPDVDRRSMLKAGGAAGLFGLGTVTGATATPGADGGTEWGSQPNCNGCYNDKKDGGNVNNTLYVGDDGRYATLSDAFADITDASTSNRYRLELVSDITETDQINVKSHIDVDGRGYRITSTHASSSPCWVRSVQDAVWERFTFDYNPSIDPGYLPAIYIRQDTYESFILRDCTLLGHDNGDGGIGIIIRHHSKPRLENVTAIAGDGGKGCYGIHCIHDSAPTLISCKAYAGGGGASSHGFVISHSSSPTIIGSLGVLGTNDDGAGFYIINSASPDIVGCEGRYRRFTQFVQISGSGSEVVDSGFPIGENNSELSYIDSFPSYIESIHFKIVTPGKTGATVDIGTTQGGSEIASDVPLDKPAEERVFFDYEPKEIAAGGKIYFTATDSGAIYNPRYVVGVNRWNQDSLYLDTRGFARISNCNFKASPKNRAGKIGPTATSAKNYVIGNCMFSKTGATANNREEWALSAKQDSGSDDPIANCTVDGTVRHINGINIAECNFNR
jgi:hypothetical protein